MVRATMVVFVCAFSTAHADRIAHLAAAIDQLAAEPYAFERAIYDAIRAKCGSTPATQCMLDTARGTCGARCAAADVIVTNQHAERALLDERTRIRLVRTSTDYHGGVLAELRNIYRLLAAELALEKPASSLAAQIDRFCVERDKSARRCAPNAPACLEHIAYQRCAAGLVWFVSTEKR